MVYRTPNRTSKVVLWSCLALGAITLVRGSDYNDDGTQKTHLDYGVNPLDPPVQLDDEDVELKNFIAHSSNMTCTPTKNVRFFNNQIRGVNLGSWFVLEPWITPSLFYQFLGGDENSTAFDSYTFCEVLGAEEANKQLKRHWETWVTEDHIKELAESGAVNSLRLPIGDFMYKSYGPYDGCFDGSLEYVDKLLDWAYQYGLTVLLDVHAIKDSQNGFDNSGQQLGFQWTSKSTTWPANLVTFQHWPIRTAEWMGKFNLNTYAYDNINAQNIAHALEVIDIIVDMYAGHPAVLGIEPVNEPWDKTPILHLKKFYWDGYLIVKKKAPYWKFIMHDMFHFDTKIWGGFMAGCPERALDTHIYQAWKDPDSRLAFYQDACNQKSVIAAMEREFGPVIVGEWSLATDNCVMWLNGFNDNLSGFPRLPCKYIPCSDPYMGFDQPGTPVDPTKAIQGPYGTGMSGPIFGYCPVGRDWLKESSGNPFTGTDWVRAPPEAPKRLDDSDNVMTNLANKKINAFSNIGHGFYFWNFRTDLYDPHWSYMAALDRGWITKGNLGEDRIVNACDKEDRGEFSCKLRKEATRENVRGAVQWCLEFENATDSELAKEFYNAQSDDDFRSVSETILSNFFDAHKAEGATCDFGGNCYLIETQYENMTDADFQYTFDDDEYIRIVYEGPNVVVLTVIVVIITVAIMLLIFVACMRKNQKFNRFVRRASLFGPLQKTKSMFLRRSLNLPTGGSEYDEIMKEVGDLQD